MMILLLAALCLSACGSKTAEPLEVQYKENYVNLTAFSGNAVVTADYGEQLYQYQVEVSGDLTQGRMDITAPDSVAGTGFTWSGGEGVVDYDTVTLETGELSPDGLSPADAMPVVLDALARGNTQSSCEEQLNQEPVICMELTNPNLQEGQEQVTVWLSREDGTLRRAEIAWEGTTVITLSFTEFSYTYSESEIEG